MTHTLFLLGYIALNICFLHGLYKAVKDIKKAIQLHKKQWITICIVRIAIAIGLIVWFNLSYYVKL